MFEYNKGTASLDSQPLLPTLPHPHSHPFPLPLPLVLLLVHISPATSLRHANPTSSIPTTLLVALAALAALPISPFLLRTPTTPLHLSPSSFLHWVLRLGGTVRRFYYEVGEVMGADIVTDVYRERESRFVL